MKSEIRKALLILIISAAIGVMSVAQEAVGKRTAPVPDAVSKGISCLASQDWVEDDLRELGLQDGKMVRVRFETASIPGISPATPNNTNVLFLSLNNQRGWLLFFRLQQDGTVRAIRNGYRVRRTKEGWSASEGNGGIATYRAISSYVAELSRRPAVRLALQSSSEGCQIE
jgi:hypothetical protein